MQADYDLVILGGGCAGLSLAMRLSKLGFACPKLLMIEKRAHYINDRIWCFWGTAEAGLKHLATQQWDTVTIKSVLGTANIDCRETPYQMLPAENFYQHALQAIAKNDRISIHFNETILETPSKVDGLWQIVSNAQIYTTKSIVDTRPAKPPQLGDALLWQSFYGHEIECEHAVFDDKTATLMDFDDDKTRVCFNYILPISKTKALIETTVFAINPITHDQLASQLQQAIGQYTANKPYTIIRSEHGILPMGNKPHASKLDSSYVQAGLFAGAARPSTGYAFQRIQRWAVSCAIAIDKTQYPISHKPDSVLQSAMDRLFLKLIRAQPSLAPMIFVQLFHRCDTAKLVRFLSDQASIKDYLAIVLALPPAPFLKQLLKSLAEKN